MVLPLYASVPLISLRYADGFVSSFAVVMLSNAIIGGAQRVGEAALRTLQRSLGVRSGQEEKGRLDVSAVRKRRVRIVGQDRTTCSSAYRCSVTMLYILLYNSSCVCQYDPSLLCSASVAATGCCEVVAIC